MITNSNAPFTCAEKLEHLSKKHEDVREEIKQRIDQRDKYVIQSVVSTVILLGATFNTKFGDVNVLLLLPPMYLYYTFLIQYSYQIHKRLSSYLVEVIEVEMSKLMSFTSKSEFRYIESYFQYGSKNVGIRSNFFVSVFIIVWIASGLLFYKFSIRPELEFEVEVSVFVMLFTGCIFLFKFCCKHKSCYIGILTLTIGILTPTAIFLLVYAGSKIEYLIVGCANLLLPFP